MEGLEWAEWERDEGRPGVPPSLTAGDITSLFGRSLTLLTAHPGLRVSRRELLGELPTLVWALRKAEGRYGDDMPKTTVGEAHEWNECRAATEALLRLLGGYLSLLLEEETT